MTRPTIERARALAAHGRSESDRRETLYQGSGRHLNRPSMRYFIRMELRFLFFSEKFP